MSTSELDGRFATKIENIERFRDEQDGVWAVVNGAYLAAGGLITASATFCVRASIDAHRAMMWHALLDYQVESFFLILDRKLSEGVALLRLASEVARDIARIGGDEARLKLWLARGSTQARKTYRAQFKFTESDPVEHYVLKLYDLASSFGVHGHILTSMKMQPVEEIGDMTVLRVPDIAVYETLSIWLATFFPLHHMCVRTFTEHDVPELRHAYALFRNMEGAFAEVFEIYRENLRLMGGEPAPTKPN
jgi:hypothetical protein